jgi:hypothetical protein
MIHIQSNSYNDILLVWNFCELFATHVCSVDNAVDISVSCRLLPDTSSTFSCPTKLGLRKIIAFRKCQGDGDISCLVSCYLFLFFQF